MGRRDEIEDGMGFAGLAPTAAERDEERGRNREWNAAIEAAAKAVEVYAMARVNETKDYPATTAAACAYRVRTLRR